MPSFSIAKWRQARQWHKVSMPCFSIAPWHQTRQWHKVSMPSFSIAPWRQAWQWHKVSMPSFSIAPDARHGNDTKFRCLSAQFCHDAKPAMTQSFDAFLLNYAMRPGRRWHKVSMPSFSIAPWRQARQWHKVSMPSFSIAPWRQAGNDTKFRCLPSQLRHDARHGSDTVSSSSQGTIKGKENFDVELAAKRFKTAMKGLGTDEAMIITMCVCHNSLQRRAIEEKYKDLYGRVSTAGHIWQGEYRRSYLAGWVPQVIFGRVSTAGHIWQGEYCRSYVAGWVLQVIFGRVSTAGHIWQGEYRRSYLAGWVPQVIFGRVSTAGHMFQGEYYRSYVAGWVLQATEQKYKALYFRMSTAHHVWQGEYCTPCVAGWVLHAMCDQAI